jgi:hypothetical protein
LSAEVVAVFFDVLFDDFGGFAVGVVAVATGAAHEFLFELRRQVVEENGLFSEIGFFRSAHRCDMFLISGSSAG